MPRGARLAEYRSTLTRIVVDASSPTLDAARDELSRGLTGLFGSVVPVEQTVSDNGAIVLGTPTSSPLVASLGLDASLKGAGREGFVLRSLTFRGKHITVIAANDDIGVLYGVFALLRRVQTLQPVTRLAVASAPRIQLRMLDHWDNLDRTVERGYAGKSLWDWPHLPDSMASAIATTRAPTRRSGSTVRR